MYPLQARFGQQSLAPWDEKDFIIAFQNLRLRWDLLINARSTTNKFYTESENKNWSITNAT